jgi:hypothetical protein
MGVKKKLSYICKSKSSCVEVKSYIYRLMVRYENKAEDKTFKNDVSICLWLLLYSCEFTLYRYISLRYHTEMKVFLWCSDSSFWTKYLEIECARLCPLPPLLDTMIVHFFGPYESLKLAGDMMPVKSI